MAVDKFLDLISKMGGKGTEKKPSTASLLDAQKEIKQLQGVMDDMNAVIADNVEFVKLLNLQLKKLSAAGKDTTKIQNKIIEQEREQREERARLDKVNQDAIDKTKELAATFGISARTLKSHIAGLDEFSDAQDDVAEGYGNQKELLGIVASKLNISTASLAGFATVAAILSAVFDAAADRVVKLNSEMIKFQRTMSGSLNAAALGFDNSGNNIEGGRQGSIANVAAANNLQVEELLATFDAFKDGAVIGLSNNLENSQKDLLEYGVTIGKVSKLYGVSNETLSELSKTLTQDYGEKISSVTSILEDGAKTAKAAGINVGIFFENMKSIAGLTGALFIKGGAMGMEKAALTLSKLGLSAAALEKVSGSITDFGGLVDRQNKAAVLGLANFSAAQAKLFAQIQTGNSEGALKLQQASLAKDIAARYTTKDGSVNMQGIKALQEVGMGQEEIASIQRLIKAQKALGVSFEEVMDETKLSVAQLAKKRNIEQENLSFLEKVGVIWNTIKEAFVDPIASILGPLLDITLTGLSVAFKVLAFLLKPILKGFEFLGAILNWIAVKFSEVGNVITATLDKFGLGGKGGSKVFNTIINVIGGLTAILIARFAWDKAQALRKFALGAMSKGKDLLLGQRMMGPLQAGEAARQGGLLGKGGALSNLGDKIKGLDGKGIKEGIKGIFKGGGEGGAKMRFRGLRGFGLGAAAGLVGEGLGSMISGDEETEGLDRSGKKRAGDTLSSVAQYAGMGAMFGPIGAGIGAAVGAIVANWDVISNFLGKVYDTLSSVVSGIWNVVKWVMPIYWIYEGIKKLLEKFSLWSDNDEKKDDKMKIGAITGGIGPNISEQLSVLTRTRGASSNQIAQEQEERMNRVFNQAPVIIKVTSNEMLSTIKAKRSVG